MDQSCSHRRGVVLLMVLVGLIVATTALVSVARQSFRLSTEANRAHRDLQQKWGTQSLNRALLRVAPTVFEARDERLRLVPWPHPAAALRGRVVLGDTQFDVLLADEDARANVNSLYHFGGREKASAAIKQISGLPLAVRLEPEASSLGAERMIDKSVAPPRAFRSWGQVFDLSRVPRLSNATGRLSCWGNPSLNVRRAPDAVVIEVAGMLLPRAKAREVVSDYRENRVNEINRIIRRHVADGRLREQLRRLLSESSVCYSLWVRSTRMGEVRDSFALVEPDANGVLRSRAFDYRGMR